MNNPDFYDSNRVGTLYVPDTAHAISAGFEHTVPPSQEDDVRTLLLLVDPQIDFIHEDGALSVPGAVADTRRTIEWLYKNIDTITNIAASLDSHVPVQIFYPTWWSSRDGEQPTPFTVITADEVEKGLWRPVVEEAWSLQYVHQLEKKAKKSLMIWPFHTMIGTPGHAITPSLYEAILFHSAARQTEPKLLVKGSIPKTEHYSILEPEVKVPEQPGGTLNLEFVEYLLTYDRIYVAGQAKSHCVLETVTSIVEYSKTDPSVAALRGKVHLLTDCMSSVAHPVIDFEALANETFDEFEQQGVKRTTSDTPLA